MCDYEIIQLKPEDYHKCSNIWNMEIRPELARSFYDELVSGNRIIYIYTVGGEFFGEGAIVFERNDPDYSIPGKRLYFSRLVVKEDYRKQGIGGILIDFIINKAVEMGYSEISIGVDKKNEGALRLYRRKGFNEIIFDGEDKYGPYYKLLKRLGGSKIDLFLQEHIYIDFSSPVIQTTAAELFDGMRDDTQKAKTAYEFVRDEIPHSFDIKSDVITAKASDVLRYETGICHAKANLLVALLRSQGIPSGFCYQHLTLADNDSMGYAVHCYNAIYLDERWINVDARGNKPGINAQFSLDDPVLAFPCRKEYDEYFWPGIYATPHEATMQMLERAKSLKYVLDNIPDMITELPDITEEAL